MANGDTKTEQMLNVLGNGGSGDEFRGCCNTKTQSYILDAIDRINALDPSGGTNAKTEFVSENQLEISGKTEQGVDATPWQFSYIVDSETGDVVPTLSDGNTTWDLGTGGGGGDSVYSTKTTSNSSTGGAVYIGNLDTNQEPVQDPSPNDNHYKYFWALPYSNNGSTYGQPGNGSVNIMGSARGTSTIAIGSNAGANSYNVNYSVMIGGGSGAGSSGVSIGTSAGQSLNAETGEACTCVGAYSNASYGVKNSIALGCYANATRTGELNIGAGTSGRGYNSTNYRVIGGVHDGQELHDVATVAQGNTLSTSAPTTSTVGVLGQLYTDTTNMNTYQLTSIDTTDPANPVYSWTQRW